MSQVRKKDKSEVVLILSTSPRGEGMKIAKRLVEEGLAACVGVSQINSVFRWKGKIEECEEDMLFIKTTDERAGDVEKRIVELSSYDVPEIIVIPLIGGLEEYLSWVKGST